MSTAEIFGPVVCIYTYDDMDDAIARANALPYSFQAAVFTRALETALRATSRLDAATVAERMAMVIPRHVQVPVPIHHDADGVVRVPGVAGVLRLPDLPIRFAQPSFCENHAALRIGPTCRN